MAKKTDIIDIKINVIGTGQVVSTQKQLSQLQAQLKKTDTAGKQLDKNMSQTRGQKQFNRSLQNIGFQVQDFAVQMQGGVDATLALSQQLPQAMVGWGAYGAVIGAVIAVGGSLIKAFFSTTEEVNKLGEALEAANSSLDKMGVAYTGLGSDMTEITAKFGSQATALVAAAEAAERLEKVKIRRDNFEGIKVLREDADDVAEMFNNDRGVLAALDKLKQSVGAKAQADALAELRKEMEASTRVTRNFSDENLEMITSVNTLEQSSRRLIALDITEEYNKQAEAAKNTGKEVKALRYDYYNLGQTLTGMQSGSEDFEAQARGVEAANAAYRDAQDPMRVYNRELALVRELRERLLITNEDLIEAEFRLDEQFNSDKIKENAKQIGILEVAMGNLAAEGVSRLVDNIMDADASFKQFAKNFIKDMTAMIAKMIILNSLKGVFGFDGGAKPLVGSAQGNVFDRGDLVPFATGGIVNTPTIFPMASGGTGLMGEGGRPEAIMPLERGSGGDLGVKANVSVNVKNYAGADVQVQQSGNDIDIIVQRVSQDIARGGTAISRTLERTYGVSRARGAA